MDTVEIEHHQIELKYANLRQNEAKPKARLIASLSEVGQQNPVLVVANGSSRYTLIDGYKRLSALKVLAKDTVIALVLELTETAALLLWHSQEQSSARSALEDGWFLQELVDQHGLNQESLSVKLQRSESWISRRLALVTVLPLEVQDKVRKGTLCAYAAGKFLVPLARARKSDCLKLVENLGRKHTSSREIESLYKSWRNASPKARQQIVSNPELFLKVEKRSTDKDRKRAKPLSERLEIISAVCCQIQIQYHRSQDRQDTKTFKAWRRAWSAFQALEGLFNEGRMDAESCKTSDDS